MLTAAEMGSLPASQGDEAPAQRRQRLRQQLLEQVLPLVEQMADTLVDAPDREIFRSIEVRLRDLGQRVAARAQQAGLDDRKKRGR